MHLAYFDENKYTKENPYFIIGGLLIPDEKAIQIEDLLSQIQYNFFGTSSLRKESEFHGKDMLHGNGNFKKRKLEDRIKLFDDLASLVIENELPLRFVCIDVDAHRGRYAYPMPEYRLAMMLILERFCDYLELEDDIGVVYGDYEKDEITRSVLDFSDFKFIGKTPMHFGRPLGRLLDTVYFTHSHHSRFLQLADVVVYLAGRYENSHEKPNKWHDIQVSEVWGKIKANADVKIQRWP